MLVSAARVRVELSAQTDSPQIGRERLAEVEAEVGGSPAEWVAIGLRHARAASGAETR
jgi:hypothetical protein